jgi:vitamin K-dependent gamma-carboxylase
MKWNDRLQAAVRTMWPRLLEPVDIASLVFFRIAFGLLLIIEVWRYFQYGWIKSFYIDPAFHFTYYGFGWVQPWPGRGMYYLFAILGASALCILLGFKYRLAAAIFFLGFTYVFLLDQARYLNHFYLISVISFLMIFVPAHRAFSLDALSSKSPPSKTVPRWALSILRAQLALMYVFAGIAKIGGDWLRGSPMRDLLARHASMPLVGPYLTDERVVMLFSYGGLLFDLFIVPLLLWPKTRYLALVFAAAFHGMNHFLFDIGIFPWFAMAGTLLFLPPDWPRRFFSRRSKDETPAAASATKRGRKLPVPTYSRAVLILLVAHFALQVIVPFRHLLYPGDVNWTDEGQRFSWRMMLRAKQGNGRFVASDRVTGQQRMINPRQYLSREQMATMWIQPDMILQFAHFAADQLRREGWQVIDIRASVAASLNGRRAQLLTDPQVNLDAEKRTLLHAKWIMPLTEPLPDATKARSRSR